MLWPGLKAIPDKVLNKLNKKKFKKKTLTKNLKMRFLKSQIIFRLANSYFIDSPQPSNLSYL